MQRISFKYFVFILAILLLPLIIFTKVYSTPSVEAKPTNGEFIIYVLKNDIWQKAGSISYDKILTEKEVSLNNYINESEKITVKIQEEGGGAAHIDSVFIGGVPPAEVRDIDDGIKKLSRKDFDVINAFGKTIEMTFNTKDIDKTLKLAARIESPNISKVPFQFPIKNLWKLMDTNSLFYSYKLNSERGSLRLDGKIEEVSNKKPFFKEYSQTGSGHPSGYTYGWVSNDDKNLYVAIDFTPDNTMDGDKDYSKVYIKTDSGLKEYKVSVPEIKWGIPGFSYTDKVEYQHKVYEFKIPLRDIYDKDMYKKDNILIAFAAYGTAFPSRPDLYSGDASVNPPIIDGNPSTFLNEWSNPATLELNAPDYPIHTYIYFKNDRKYLYVLADAVGDTTNGAGCDECLLEFGFPRSKDIEVALRNGEIVTDPAKLSSGSQVAVSFGTSFNDTVNNHRIYELKIRLTSLSLRSGQITDFKSPRKKALCYWGSIPFDGGLTTTPPSSGWDDDRDNVYPYWLIEQNVDTYARLHLYDQGEPIPTLNEWGMIIFIVLAGLGAVYFLRKRKRAES